MSETTEGKPARASRTRKPREPEAAVPGSRIALLVDGKAAVMVPRCCEEPVFSLAPSRDFNGKTHRDLACRCGLLLATLMVQPV
jgi:hypothetical protein